MALIQNKTLKILSEILKYAKSKYISLREEGRSPIY